MNGKCYPVDPGGTDPNGDGKCPQGYGKVGDKCVPYQPESKEDREEEDKDKESRFGGACGGFTCDGDAIQCAIAKEQHRRACKLFDDKSPESELYAAEKGKEGAQTENLPGNRNETLQGRISTVDALGGGQCIRDLNITVMGQGVTLPMSEICPTLGIIGNIMVAVAFLAAIRIVGRG